MKTHINIKTIDATLTLNHANIWQWYRVVSEQQPFDIGDVVLLLNKLSGTTEVIRLRHGADDHQHVRKYDITYDDTTRIILRPFVGSESITITFSSQK